MFRGSDGLLLARHVGLEEISPGQDESLVEKMLRLAMAFRSNLQVVPTLFLNDAVEVCFGYNVVHQPDGQRFLRAQKIAGKRNALGSPEPHVARQAIRAHAGYQ